MATEPLDLNVDFFTGQPYPLWARARSECPVAPMDGSAMGADRPMVAVTRWEDVEAVLRDGDTFSSSINAEHIGQFMGDLMLAMDGKEHRSYRALVSHAFRPSQLEQWDAALVLPTIERLLDAIRPDGAADLVAAVTSQYPVEVILGIVGVPLADVDRFARWAVEINTGPLDPVAGMVASQAMRDYLAPIVEARRAEPTGDLISDMVHAEIDGEKLHDEKIYGFLRLLLPAGAETTFRAMGNALTALLTVPGLYDRVVADRDLVPALIEETLRWETSITQVSRLAVRDTEIGGCPVAAGTAVSVLVASANHDEDRYPHSEDFDLDRPMQNTMTFGTGQHQCLGMHLARMEMRTGINAILDALPNLRLDPEKPAPVIQGLAFRGPDAIHVRYDPT